VKPDGETTGAMQCGQAIFVKDRDGAWDCRFIAQCGGRFLLLSRVGDHRNGWVMADWRMVLRELIALAVPARLTEKVVVAESTATGLYVNMPLTYPLSVTSLAGLLAVPVDNVRFLLADLAVSFEG
jgi:hypothetical protein